MKNGCIIGYGAIGPIHAAALYKIKSLYGICDTDQKRLSKCEYDGVKFYTDYNDVLTDSNVDVVHICTPHYLHAEMVLSALKHKKDVVLEKPTALNAEEFNKLLTEAEKYPNKVCVMLQNRINPCILKLKEICDSKTYGNITGASAFLTWMRNADYYKSDEWRGKWSTEGGGLLINQSVHLIDLCGWLCGGIKSVRGSISTKHLDDVIEVEDTADALFETGSGIRVCFYATNCHQTGSPMRLELDFGDVTFRYSDYNLYKIHNGICETICSDSKAEIGKSYWGKGHFEIINSFYKSLETGSGEYTPLKDCENSMNALFAIYESAKNNKKIEI